MFKKSHRFSIGALFTSPPDDSNAANACPADLVNDTLYSANVEHVTTSFENACLVYTVFGQNGRIN